jgi:carbon storage regulator
MPDRNQKIVIVEDDASTRQAIAPLHRFHPAQEENAMLVLSRKRGERIVIGPNIELTVVDIRGNKVLLAVDAPRDVSIHRQEVYRRIQDEGGNAVKGNMCTGAGCR